MPNLATALPRRTGDLEEDYNRLYNWAVSLTDELKSLLCNLDSGNVTEAASIKAQNIDASQAKIKDAQIASLTADKLTAGTIDAGKITVKGENAAGSMTLTGDSLVFLDTENKKRIFIGNENGNMVFKLWNGKSGQESQGVYMNSEGRIYLTGDINTDKDCVIQGQLRVGLRDSKVNKGIAFYGMQYNHDGTNNSYCGGIFPYLYAYTSGVPTYDGICIDSSLRLYVGDDEHGEPVYKKALTENDLTELKDAINTLSRQTDTGNNE